ncbi:MAG: hypothetical protein R3A10_01440 [Caldilineaceae bacterium]
MIALVCGGGQIPIALDGSVMQRFATERPRLTQSRTRYVFYPNLSVVPIRQYAGGLPTGRSVLARSRFRPAAPGAYSLAQGGVAGGYVLFIKDIKLHYIHNPTWGWKNSR